MSGKIYDGTFTPSELERDAYVDFVAIVRQLRRDCPWDREQTHESVKHLLIEEAYETIEAIEAGDWEELKKELGDLFLHVVFHGVMGEEEDRFTLEDVIRTETAKLVRRHPHVFGEGEAGSAEEVLTSWEQIKMQEGKKTSALEGVPRELPALLRALRIQEKAAGVGFDFPEREGAWEKVEEETDEFHAAARSRNASDAEKEEEFGDLLFALVNYARRVGINPENALRRTMDKFTYRFQHVEKQLSEAGRTMSEAELTEMDRLWKDAKERGSRGIGEPESGGVGE